MKILLITTHFNTGGITSYCLTLGEALVQSGHQVWVASSGGNAVLRLDAAGIRHVRVGIRTKSEVHPKVFLCIAPLARLIREERIDIIHSQTRVTQVLGYFLSRITGVHMVTTCHGYFKPRWFRKFFPCWGSAVIAISKPVARHLRDDFNIPQARVHLVANGIDLNRFKMTDDGQRRSAREKYGLDDAPLIGTIARLSDVKGLDTLVSAMPGVLKGVPSARLLIAGRGPQEGLLKQLTADLSLTGHVSFKDTIEETQALLPAFDVFVMPSLMEGLGLSVIEAQACGVPVVASRIGGLIDLVEDGKTGFLVPVKDPSSLAERIIELLRDPSRANAMARQARLNIEDRFTAEKMLKGTLRIYEQYSRR